MEEKLEKLQDKVNRLTNIAWVLGTLAVIFGLSGGFGIKTILAANDRLTELNTKVIELDEKISDSDELFNKYREDQQVKFDEYIESKKNEIVFTSLFNNKISQINQRISGITLTASQHSSPDFACGQKAVKTPTDLIVMYGSKDGTGCGIRNINYFKTLALNIPK